MVPKFYEQTVHTGTIRLVPVTTSAFTEHEMTEVFTAGVMIFIEQFRARWPWSIDVVFFRPEDVSHSRGRNVEGKES